jgi:hypothetical protein
MTETIRLTRETMAQYKRDCKADAELENPTEHKFHGLRHDTEFVGRCVFVRKEYIGYRFTKEQIRVMELFTNRFRVGDYIREQAR